jgi:hypothetical protein
MVLTAQLMFAAACTLTKLSMLMLVRRMLCTASLMWRRITLLAITVVSIQGTVFCITIIFQCRSVTLITILALPLQLLTLAGIKTAPRLLESKQRATTQLHQSSVLSARGRHHQHPDRFCRCPPPNSNNLVTPDAHSSSAHHNHALQSRVCVLWFRDTAHLLHV